MCMPKVPRVSLLLARWILFCPFFICTGFATHAQTDKAAPFADRPNQPLIALNPRHVDTNLLGGRVNLQPVWLVQAGDNPDWAEPGYDDSSWPMIDIGEFHPERHDPISWYRIHIALRPGLRDLAVIVRLPSGHFQLFANGRNIGGSGDPRKIYDSYRRGAESLRFNVPAEVLGKAPGELVLAVRASGVRGSKSKKIFADFGEVASIYLESQEAADRDVSDHFAHRAAATAVETVLGVIVGCVALAIAFALRRNREYIAITVVIFSMVGTAILGFFFFETGSQLFDYGATACSLVSTVAQVEFIRLILQRRRSSIFLGLEAMFLLLATLNALTSANILAPSYLPSLPIEFIIYSVLIGLLIRPALKGSVDARVLVPTQIIYGGENFIELALWATGYYAKHPSSEGLQLSIGGYAFDLYELANIVYFLAILLFLVLRTIRIARERQRAVGELEAARTTQALLFSHQHQSIPGFRVEAAYHPASEVGGDFFLTLPGPSQSLLAIVGDVSGKGLTAAMRVSMILGILSREISGDPGEILQNLNRTLFAHGGAGFTTACCVHLTRDGTFRAANAGHIAPYVDGAEIQTVPALPLGLTPDQTYPIVEGHLAPDQRMVLLSDGVIEARSSNGELLGFDRAASLTRQPAEEIATAAQTFGQEDDITVVTIALV
jgi:hypothetical protein